MVDTDLMLNYMQLTQRVPGIRCPKCGVSYVMERIASTIVREGETMIERK